MQPWRVLVLRQVAALRATKGAILSKPKNRDGHFLSRFCIV